MNQTIYFVGHFCEFLSESWLQRFVLFRNKVVTCKFLVYWMFFLVCSTSHHIHTPLYLKLLKAQISLLSGLYCRASVPLGCCTELSPAGVAVSPNITPVCT